MTCRSALLSLFALALLLVPQAQAAKPKPSAGNDKNPPHVDADFAIQGEYVGTVHGQEGDKTLAAQVIALGDHKFRAVGRVGGLPGAGWNGKAPEEVEATAKDGAVSFHGKYATGTIKDGSMTVASPSGEKIGQLARVVRESPTLGEKPPAGAIVLFDGKSADEWASTPDGKQPGHMTDDGLLMQGAYSKRKFGALHLHLEFRLPYMPAARGQQRGNSGCYLQGRYEVQMLDSFGLAGENNECGGIYEIARPTVNMCYPPLSWQTYDIDFTPAKFDNNGKKLNNALVTVRHNGTLIHDKVELPRTTKAAPNHSEADSPGSLHLQDHHNAVQYRNIWVVEGK